MSNKDINVIVGERLREYRKLMDLSQADFAEKTGINRATISQLEAGKQQFTVGIIYTIAQKLNEEITTFLPLLRHIQSELSSTMDIIEEQLSQQDVTQSTKDSILQLIHKKPEHDQ